MTRKLILGPKISLPLDAVTETFGILAVRGAGKSNTAAVMAEEMFRARLPFVVVDPVGSWWGLRSSKNGKGPGLAIPIFGGKHGDIPLERGGGQIVADLVVDQRLSLVLDLTGFDSEAAKKQFLLDFAKRLYQRNEAPLHLFLEESDDYIPQRPMRDEQFLLRAFENIVRRGRARGLGITLITQRSASLNKNVLTQVQTLIAMRTTGPQDRKAIKDWVEYHDQQREIVESLPSLEDGEAWVWSPDFLRKTVRVQFRRRQTFDSGATPKQIAAISKRPATLADVDLKKVQKQMSATIERAKQTDPKVLQARVRTLEEELRKANTFMTTQRPARESKVIKKIEVPVIKETHIRRMERVVIKLLKVQDWAGTLGAEIRAATNKKFSVPNQIELSSKPRSNAFRPVPPRRPAGYKSTTEFRADSVDFSADKNGKLPGGEREILIAVAQHSTGVTRKQLTQLTGYKESTRNAYIARLQSKGFVNIQSGIIESTAKGVAALGEDYQPLPTGSDLRKHWLHKLPEGERALFELLCKEYPSDVNNDLLSQLTGYKESTRNAYLSRLQARQLIIRERGFSKVEPELFK